MAILKINGERTIRNIINFNLFLIGFPSWIIHKAFCNLVIILKFTFTSNRSIIIIFNKRSDFLTINPHNFRLNLLIRIISDFLTIHHSIYRDIGTTYGLILIVFFMFYRNMLLSIESEIINK